MDAAADYAAAKLALTQTLPAYVSYRVVSHAGAGPFAKDDDQTIVVRTHDGKVVRGKPPSIQIGADSKEDYNRDIVDKPPFDPACYTPTSAHEATFENRPVEALDLHETCGHDEKDGDFGILFVDLQTHAPIAASGGNSDESVAVRVVQKYTPVAGFYLPAALDVRVKGSGWMSWLDVIAFEHFSDYVFSSAAP